MNIVHNKKKCKDKKKKIINKIIIRMKLIVILKLFMQIVKKSGEIS